jgi:hypothetical protein
MCIFTPYDILDNQPTSSSISSHTSYNSLHRVMLSVMKCSTREKA